MAYRGDTPKRKSMQFYILFADGSYRWVTWSTDLFVTVSYEDYCRALLQLLPLIHTIKQSTDIIKDINLTSITAVKPKDLMYLDLSALGAGWFESLGLPDPESLTYVMPMRYTEFVAHTKINAVISLLTIV